MTRLETEEYFCLLNALNVTKEYYLKHNQSKRAVEAQQLFDLLFCVGGDSLYIDTTNSLRPEKLQEELQKREARLKPGGADVISFPVGDRKAEEDD